MKKLTIFLPLRLFPAALPLRMRKPAPIRIRAHHHVAGIRSPFQQKAHAGTEAIPLARDGLSSRHRFSWKARSRSWALEARKKSGGGRVRVALRRAPRAGEARAPTLQGEPAHRPALPRLPRAHRPSGQLPSPLFFPKLNSMSGG